MDLSLLDDPNLDHEIPIKDRKKYGIKARFRASEAQKVLQRFDDLDARLDKLDPPKVGKEPRTSLSAASVISFCYDHARRPADTLTVPRRKDDLLNDAKLFRKAAVRLRAYRPSLRPSLRRAAPEALEELAALLSSKATRRGRSGGPAADKAEARLIRDWRQVAIAATGTPQEKLGTEVFFLTFGTLIDLDAFSQRAKRAHKG